MPSWFLRICTGVRLAYAWTIRMQLGTYSRWGGVMSHGKDYTNVKEENQARAQNRTIFQFPSIPKYSQVFKKGKASEGRCFLGHQAFRIEG